MKSSSLAGPLSLAVLLLLPLRLLGQTGDLRVVVATSGSKLDTMVNRPGFIGELRT